MAAYGKLLLGYLGQLSAIGIRPPLKPPNHVQAAQLLHKFDKKQQEAKHFKKKCVDALRNFRAMSVKHAQEKADLSAIRAQWEEADRHLAGLPSELSRLPHPS